MKYEKNTVEQLRKILKNVLYALWVKNSEVENRGDNSEEHF